MKIRAERESGLPSGADRLAGSKTDVSGISQVRRIRVLPATAFCASTAQNICSAVDAAAFLVRAVSPVSWLKLQDLLYFAQGWHLVWDNELLFPEPILATGNGVQVEVIDRLLAGQFEVSAVRGGKPTRLTESQQRTLVGIARHYAGRSHFRLSELIRGHKPWLEARAASVVNTPAVIDPAVMYGYYRDN